MDNKPTGWRVSYDRDRETLVASKNSAKEGEVATIGRCNCPSCKSYWRREIGDWLDESMIIALTSGLVDYIDIERVKSWKLMER